MITGISYDLDYMKGYPPVVNDDKKTDIVIQASDEVSTVDAIQSLEPDLGGEDFSYYLQRVPGTFYYTGVRNASFRAVYRHNPGMFDFTEKELFNALSIVMGSVLIFF